MLMDLNGNPICIIDETLDLRDQAEQQLIEKISLLEKQITCLLKDYQEFPELSEALSVPVKEFLNRTRILKRIIEKGTIQTEFLGITQQEDYSDMRKELLKEMMYYIDTHRD